MSAILLLSTLLSLPATTLDGAVHTSFAANDLYCRSTAAVAIRVAGKSDDDLADAARMIHDAAAQNVARRLQVAEADTGGAAAMADARTQALVAEYTRTHARQVLADALVECAHTL